VAAMWVLGIREPSDDSDRVAETVRRKTGGSVEVDDILLELREVKLEVDGLSVGKEGEGERV
jgi:hypothetical protein